MATTSDDLALLQLFEDDAKGSLLVISIHLQKKQRREPRLLRIESEAVQRLIAQQDDYGYEKYIRFHRASFAVILSRFAPIFERTPLTPLAASSPQLAKRCLSTREALFVLLRLLAGNTAFPDLAVIAGASVGALSRLLRVALVALLVALRHWFTARIQAPTVEEAAELATRIASRLPYLPYFIGFEDGTPGGTVGFQLI